MIPTKTERAYLDWNATAPLRPQARAAMVAALDAIGNPSSVHAEGREARGIVEAARESVALLVGAEPRHVVFTASGTEANVLALSPQTGGHWQRLLVSTIVAMLLAQWMLAPIHVIQSGLTRLGRGELDVRLDLPAGSEFKDLGSSFFARTIEMPMRIVPNGCSPKRSGCRLSNVRSEL